jgi:hypothetical protein
VGPIPEDIKRFLDRNIETLEQLEILRILGEDRAQARDASALAEMVQTQPQIAAQHLAALDARGLLTLAVDGTGQLARHGPKTPELEDMVNRLLQLYKERPVTLIKLVYARASDPLRAFADSFRLRKEE